MTFAHFLCIISAGLCFLLASLAWPAHGQDELVTTRIGQYVIAAADDGRPLRPSVAGNSEKPRIRTQPMSSEEMETYLDEMMKQIDHGPINSNGDRDVLIFIHGGMNQRNGAIERAARLAPEFIKNRQYPIFIAWNSAPLSCYSEHMFLVRQGQRRSLLQTIPTLPFYFLADLTRGVSRAPVVWERLIENGLTQPAGLFKNTPHIQRIVYGQAANLYLAKTGKHRPHITPTNIRDSDWRGTETIFPAVAHAIFGPTKAIGALLLDTIGTGAWDVMLRRANVLFDSPVRNEDFNEPRAQEGDLTDRKRIVMVTKLVQERKPRERQRETQAAVDRQMSLLLGKGRLSTAKKVDFHSRSRPGAVELLLQRLSKEQKENKKRYSITLIGHSMGAIVSNEMLKRHSDLPFDRIVYLAAACSVKDCQDSVVPYLVRRYKNGRPAKFYNLSLHPVAEVSESFGGGSGPLTPGKAVSTAAGVMLVPQGSLLEWLDGFFTKPMTYEDRRLGKWGTAITSMGIFPEEVRDSVYFKMFPVGLYDLQIPEKHGSFADGEGKVHFWDESFLNPCTRYERKGESQDAPWEDCIGR